MEAYYRTLAMWHELPDYPVKAIAVAGLLKTIEEMWSMLGDSAMQYAEEDMFSDDGGIHGLGLEDYPNER
jgi:hypothetical protein